MTWWKKLVGSEDEFETVDYYAEGLALCDSGNVHEALTSFRLALKERPGDVAVLQQIAIAYSRIGMVDEAAKTYRHVLQKRPSAVGALYGLGFLLVRSGKDQEGRELLEQFLTDPPRDAVADRFVAHARDTLDQLHHAARASGAGRESNTA